MLRMPSDLSQPPASSRRRFRFGDLILLLVLLILPAAALAILVKQIDWRYVVAYFTLISGITLGIYSSDKWRAQKGGYSRTPEKALHILELAGGWPAAFIAQRFLRHKTSKVSFQVVFWMIVLLHQLLALESLLSFRITKTVLKMASEAGSRAPHRPGNPRPVSHDPDRYDRMGR